jgi:hypothetical protein
MAALVLQNELRVCKVVSDGISESCAKEGVILHITKVPPGVSTPYLVQALRTILNSGLIKPGATVFLKEPSFAKNTGITTLVAEKETAQTLISLSGRIFLDPIYNEVGYCFSLQDTKKKIEAIARQLPHLNCASGLVIKSDAKRVFFIPHPWNQRNKEKTLEAPSSALDIQSSESTDDTPFTLASRELVGLGMCLKVFSVPDEQETTLINPHLCQFRLFIGQIPQGTKIDWLKRALRVLLCPDLNGSDVDFSKTRLHTNPNLRKGYFIFVRATQNACSMLLPLSHRVFLDQVNNQVAVLDCEPIQGKPSEIPAQTIERGFAEEWNALGLSLFDKVGLVIEPSNSSGNTNTQPSSSLALM